MYTSFDRSDTVICRIFPSVGLDGDLSLKNMAMPAGACVPVHCADILQLAALDEFIGHRQTRSN
jgi:hypothetical protein